MKVFHDVIAMLDRIEYPIRTAIEVLVGKDVNFSWNNSSCKVNVSLIVNIWDFWKDFVLEEGSSSFV
jgi:hypothetical protein